MWVEKLQKFDWTQYPGRHPPCEDVSWKTEDSKWTRSEIVILLVRMWVENFAVLQCSEVSPSSSLWGCELKINGAKSVAGSNRHPPCEDVSWKAYKTQPRKAEAVILLVRMWVEKSVLLLHWWYPAVILLVRMWVEKVKRTAEIKYKESSSLWGCELKRKLGR